MGDPLAEAFDNFEAASRESRELIEATPRFRERPEHRAQAYASMAEARAMAYSLIVAPRMDHPHTHGQSSWYTTFFSLGQTCQDFRYGGLLLDGRATYRLHGHVGGMKLALVQVHSHVMGHPDAEEIGNHDLVELAAPDGTFEVELGANVPEGEGIRLNRDSLNFLLLRRVYCDISDDAGDLRIERVGGEAPAPETDPAVIAERLNRAADMLRFLTRNWCIGLYDMYVEAAGGKNRFAHIHGKELASSIVGSPSTIYGLGIFELEPDEALIVEWDPPDSAYWSFQLGDVWSNALDFVNYQTDVGMKTAAIDSDGRFRAVACAQDPGIANWLDTRGRTEGSIVMRNYRPAGESAAPALRVVPFAELRDHLPDDVRTVGPEERESMLAERRSAHHLAFEA